MNNSLKELDLDMNPEMINNPQEIFTNISEVEGLDPNQIVEIRNLIKDLGTEKLVLMSTLKKEKNYQLKWVLMELVFQD